MFGGAVVVFRGAAPAVNEPLLVKLWESGAVFARERGRVIPREVCRALVLALEALVLRLDSA